MRPKHPGPSPHLTLSGPQGKWSSEVVNAGAHVTMAPPAGDLVFH